VSLGSITLVSALVYVFVVPAAGIIIALLFFDLRIREERVQTSPAIGTHERTLFVVLSPTGASNAPACSGLNPRPASGLAEGCSGARCCV
jgi:hypothetical protein